MKNGDFYSEKNSIRCMIQHAEMFCMRGKLVKAARILEKAKALILMGMEIRPGDTTLDLLKTRHEKCWNKIIESMAKNIQSDCI